MRSQNNRLLMDDDFWNSAFDRNETFRTEFLTEFRRGIVEGIEDDLAWTRLAIYGVREIALWPILLRIIELAALTPRAEFVESFAFFVSSDENLLRLKSNLHDVSEPNLRAALADVTKLRHELTAAGDDDLSERLVSLQDLLTELAK